MAHCASRGRANPCAKPDAFPTVAQADLAVIRGERKIPGTHAAAMAAWLEEAARATLI
jgi:hypothetical protein